MNRRLVRAAALLGVAFSISLVSNMAHADIDNFAALGVTSTHNDYIIGPDGSFRAYSNGSGVYISNDYGANFTRTLSVSFQTLYLGASASRQYLVAGGTKSYFSNTNRNYGSYLYYSSDYGATWTERTAAGEWLWRDFEVSDDGQKILAITAAGTGKDADNTNAIIANGSSRYSSNGGQSFTTAQTAASTYGNRQWRSLAMADNGSVMFITDDYSGMWRSTDGSTWTQIYSSGYRYVATSSSGQYVYATGWATNIKNSNYGQGTWSSMSSLPSNLLPANLSVSDDGQYILLGAATDGIWESKDGGATFRESPVFTGSYAYPLLEWKTFGIAMSATGTYVLINTDYGLHLAKSVPNQVTSFTASYFENKQVTLNWSAPANNGSPITDYKVLYTDEPPMYATNWIEYVHTPDTATTLIVRGLTSGTPYLFKVAAVNAYGVGQYSAIDNGYPVSGPETVTAVSATAGNERITLTWTAPLNNGGFAISNYKIGVKPDGGSWSEISTGSTTESATVTGLVNGTAYSVRIIAVNSQGDGDIFLLQNTVTPVTLPGAPTNVAATHSNERVVLTWDLPTSTGGSPINDYQIEYSSNSGSTWNTVTRTPSVARVETITALSNGTEYRFKVSSKTSVGTGAASSSVTSTPSTFASAPTNLLVTASNESVSISFTAGSSGGATITDYLIEYSTDSGSTWSTHTQTPDATSPIFITGLTNYLNYRFKLSSININGTGSASSATVDSMPTGTLTSISLTRNSVGTAAGAGFSTQPQITLRDQNSETILTDSSTVITATISVGGSLVGSTTATAIAGVATFSNLGILGTAGTSYTVTYSTAGATSVTQSVTVTAGVASKLRISRSSAGAQTGTPFTTQPIILVVDAGNNTISSHPNTTITATLDNSNCFFATSTETASALSGSATFSGLGIISSSGTQCLITYSAFSLTSALETITVTSGPAASITRRTRPGSGYYGRAFGQQPVYLITDIGGNIVTTDNTTVLTVTTPNNGGATIIQESMTAVNGVVTFTGLGFSGINAGTFVLFRVSTTGFSNYYTDSVIIVKGDPVLTWSDSTKLSGASAYTVTAPTSNAAGTFAYTSSNSGVASVSGNTITVVGQGNTTLTATLTPTDTNNFNSDVSVTSTLTVTAGAATISISLAGGVVTVAKGTAINITASVNAAGKVKFMVNGKVIGGCAAKSATTSATCSWKPTTQGQSVALTAILNPTSSSFSNVRSTALNVGVGRRAGRR